MKIIAAGRSNGSLAAIRCRSAWLRRRPLLRSPYMPSNQDRCGRAGPNYLIADEYPARDEPSCNQPGTSSTAVQLGCNTLDHHSSRSHSVTGGRIVIGSNNFRSPTTCACLCTSVCRFQHPEQPAMVTRRRAPARYMFTLPECSKLVWGQALAQGQISAVDRGWCLRGAATAALPRPIYRITCPSRARLSRSFPGPRQASWLDVPDNRPLSGRFTGRSLFREQNNSQRMGFSRGNPSAPGYGERADDRGGRSPGGR